MKHLSAVSSFSKACIGITPDNRIHLWDTDTRRERSNYVEKNHLSHTYTCHTWKQDVKDNLGIFAVGCSDGTVIMWDLVRGVVTRTIGVANESPAVTDIVISNDSKSIYVCSLQSSINQHSLSDGSLMQSFKGGKKGVLKVALNPKVEVLAIGR